MDTSFNYKEATLVTDGTTIVEQGDTDWTWINEMYLNGAGTGLAAAGTITLSNDAAANPQGLIEAGNYQIHNCHWKVAAGHQGLVHGFWGAPLGVATAAGGVYFALQVARHGLQGVASSETYETIAEMYVSEIDEDIATTSQVVPGYFEFPGGMPVVIPEKAIVRLAAKSTTGSVAVTGGFNIILVGGNAGGSAVVN